MGTVTALRPIDRNREAAHEAIRHTADLLSATNEFCQFPGAVTESDKEVLSHRLKCLIIAYAKMDVNP